MDVMDLIARASAMHRQVQGRTVSEPSLESYQKEFRRMWRAGDLDPLKPGIALDTYYHRRAALHFVGSLLLEHATGACLTAIERRDVAEIKTSATKLRRAVERLEPAFAREPPAPPGMRPGELPPSRWHQSENDHRKRGESSKRHLLAALPRNWDQLLWGATSSEWPYRVPLAVLLTIPVRSEELVAGSRPAGYSPGVVLEFESSSGLLTLSFMPVKSHRGLYGTEQTTITIDSGIADEPARCLASLCKEAGGRLVVGIPSKNALRKAMTKLGAKTFLTIKGNITPNLARHQLIADMKKTFGAGVKVAAAAGQGTERTQSRYGYYQHGRKRHGYVSIVAARPPRKGFTDRVKQLKIPANNSPKIADTES
jgi:hypothetical protein